MNSPGSRAAPAPLNASASTSASTRLDVFDGEWQQIAAAAVLPGVLAALRGFRGKRPAQHPRERTLQHPRERTLKHPPERTLKHPPERTLQHPEEAAQNPTEEAGRGSPSAS